MKSTALTTTLLLLLLSPAHAQLLPFLTNRQAQPPTQQQNPIMSNTPPGVQLPPSNDKTKDTIILSDVLGTQPTINIFAGFTQDIPSVSLRLANAGQNTTLLAPTNAAITSLPRKPWEDPREYSAFGADAYGGVEGGERARENLRRFTEAHVVPFSPWGEGERVERLGGGRVWWERREDKVVVMPGNVEVEGVVSRVGNGEVWVLRGVLDYAADSS